MSCTCTTTVASYTMIGNTLQWWGTVNEYETGFTFIFGASWHQSSPHDLPFWRCSDPSLFDSCQSHTDLFAHPLFLLPTHDIQELTVDLLPNISNPLKAAVVTMQSILFTSHVSGFNVVANQFMGNAALLDLRSTTQFVLTWKRMKGSL